MSGRTIPLVASDTIWVARCPVPTLTGLALRTGRLADAFAGRHLWVRGIREANDVRFREQGFYHDVKTLFREGGNYPALAARALGHDTSVVVGLTWIDETQLLLARPNSGLAGAGAAVLKQAIFGLSRAPVGRDIWRAMALRAYDTALKQARLERSDVTLRDLTPYFGPAGALPGGTWSAVSEGALLAGEVDIIYAKGAPAVALQKKHGLDVVLDLNTLPDRVLRINNGTPRPITVHRHLLDDAPELVVEFLKTLIETGRWARENATEVAAVVAAETGTTEADVLAGYGADLATQFEVGLSDEWIASLQDQSDFLSEAGLISARVDVGKWIEPGLLTAARWHSASAPSAAPRETVRT